MNEIGHQWSVLRLEGVRKWTVLKFNTEHVIKRVKNTITGSSIGSVWAILYGTIKTTKKTINIVKYVEYPVTSFYST